MKTFDDKLVICIEGRRRKDGRLNAYKMDAAIIAIYGHCRIRSGQVKVVIHDRILTKELTLDNKENLTKKLRNLAERETRIISFLYF